MTRTERLTACFATKLITGARESDIKNGLLRALNLNRNVFNMKTWLLSASDAVNLLKLKDTILSKGPDTMSPDYSIPAPDAVVTLPQPLCALPVVVLRGVMEYSGTVTLVDLEADLALSDEDMPPGELLTLRADSIKLLFKENPSVDTKIRWLAEVTRTFHLDWDLAEVKTSAPSRRLSATHQTSLGRLAWTIGERVLQAEKTAVEDTSFQGEPTLDRLHQYQLSKDALIALQQISNLRVLRLMAALLKVNEEYTVEITEEELRRALIREPQRCYKCQKFEHHQSRCLKKVRCGICSVSLKREMCIQKHKEGTTTTAKCPNCGMKHHAWSTSCPERREWMKVAMAKVQPQNRTEAPRSTFVWGQQRQNTVNPTPTPPQLSEDSFPALPPPGYRTKLKTPGQNQSIQETMTNQWTPQPQLQSCVAVKGHCNPFRRPPN
ncbi:hypothetical protein Hamer_G014375 [Homarus americanus]|uniref:Gag-like protein n=1 Tax=Homarus americanus TaxID=6706 RepID=A0A8J5JTL3_HOMAM|nr:hypothetical protein Hamer_G014375 [Homarus americanus]